MMCYFFDVFLKVTMLVVLHLLLMSIFLHLYVVMYELLLLQQLYAWLPLPQVMLCPKIMRHHLIASTSSQCSVSIATSFYKLLPYLILFCLFVCLDELVLEAKQVSKAKGESEWYYVCISIRFFHFALPFFLLRSRLLQSLRQSSAVQCSVVQCSVGQSQAKTSQNANAYMPSSYLPKGKDAVDS